MQGQSQVLHCLSCYVQSGHNALHAAGVWTNRNLAIIFCHIVSDKMCRFCILSTCNTQLLGGFDCQATKNLADMAAEMPNLKSFVHVSTAYVNGNQPKGTSVSENLLPLDGEGADHASLVTQLQGLSRAQATSQVSCSHHRGA